MGVLWVVLALLFVAFWIVLIAKAKTEKKLLDLVAGVAFIFMLAFAAVEFL